MPSATIAQLSATLDGPRSTQLPLNNSPSIQPNLDSKPADLDQEPPTPHKKETGKPKKAVMGQVGKVRLLERLNWDCEMNLESETL